MKFLSLIIFFMTVGHLVLADTPPPLFLEVEQNSQEVFRQFDEKSSKTLSTLSGESGFEELRRQIADDIDKGKKEAKKSVSYTKSWAYNYYRDDKKPKGVYRRVEKSLYKKLKKEGRLDEVPWKVVIDIDHFINTHTFPKEITQPSSGNWSCLREKESRELKRCLIGFSQSGGDRQIYYEFDFTTFSWVEESSFQYEVLGRTSFTWMNENQVLVAIDEMSHYNHNNPQNQISMEEAVAKQMISFAGYPIKLVTWKRGESFDPSRVVFMGTPSAQGVSGGPIKMKDRPKDRVFFFYEYYSHNKILFYISVKTTSGAYKTSLMNKEIPSHMNDFKLLPIDDKKVRIVFNTKSQWGQYDERDLLVTELEIISPNNLVVLPPKPIFRLPEDQGTVSSMLTIDGNKFDPTDDKIILIISHNVSDSITLLSQIDGQWKASQIPDPLNLKYKSMWMWEDRGDKSIYLSVQSFLTPYHKYTINLSDKGLEFELIKEGLTSFDSSDYKIDQLWVDRGTDQNGKEIKVPYFIIYNPSQIQLSENPQPVPTQIYAYGGFSLGHTPFYLGGIGKRWLDRGGAYVLANIRGGDEFGPYWHQSSLKKNRSNTFGDFIAVSEDLIQRGITSPQKLAIEGGSNGGLLTGVAVTQRPDLYQAVVTSAPLLDMMRYHKLLVGSSWMDEYGDPEGDEKETWLRYSPLHNLQKGVKYPKIYIKTNRFDDRVHPAHARKFALRLDELGGRLLFL